MIDHPPASARRCKECRRLVRNLHRLCRRIVYRRIRRERSRSGTRDEVAIEVESRVMACAIDDALDRSIHSTALVRAEHR